MDNINETDSQESENLENGSSNKRVATPVLVFTDAFAFVDNINNKLGSHTYHKNQTIADASGFALPTIRQTLSTCQQYGLLELKHGVGYKPTPLFESILYPKDENEKRTLSIESLKHSPILGALIDMFEGKNVPVLTGIQNTIVRDLGIKEIDKANKVATIFVDNLKYLKLINDKGVLATTSQFEKPQDEKPPNEKPKDEKPKNEVADRQKHVIDQEDIDIPIPLRNRQKDAHLIISRDYTDLDLDRIIKFVNALKNDEPT